MYVPISTRLLIANCREIEKQADGIYREAVRRTTRALGARSLRSHVPLCCGPSESVTVKDICRPPVVLHLLDKSVFLLIPSFIEPDIHGNISYDISVLRLNIADI